MAQRTPSTATRPLQRRIMRYLAPAEGVRESAHLASTVVDRLSTLLEDDEARIREFLDTPDAHLANRTPAEIARVHGYDALDRLVDQLEDTSAA